MTTYRCTGCGHVYDPSVGDPESDVPPHTQFDDLVDEEWDCPGCGGAKDDFVPFVSDPYASA